MSVIARPGHPLAALAAITLADLVTQTWVLHPMGSPMRGRVEQALQHASLSAPPDIIETSSILATTTLVEASDMVSVVPQDVAQHYARYGMVAVLKVALPIEIVNLGIITRKKRGLSGGQWVSECVAREPARAAGPASDMISEAIVFAWPERLCSSNVLGLDVRTICLAPR